MLTEGQKQALRAIVPEFNHAIPARRHRELFTHVRRDFQRRDPLAMRQKPLHTGLAILRGPMPRVHQTNIGVITSAQEKFGPPIEGQRSHCPMSHVCLDVCSYPLQRLKPQESHVA
eukprot:Skav233828  [mRNA]  locus=scaffold100:110299:113337:- [translate_table: standard]